MGKELPGHTLITNPKSPSSGSSRGSRFNALTPSHAPYYPPKFIVLLCFPWCRRHQGEGPKWTSLAPKEPDSLGPSLPLLSAEPRNPVLHSSGQGQRGPDLAGSCLRSAPGGKATEASLVCLVRVPSPTPLTSPHPCLPI